MIDKGKLKDKISEEILAGGVKVGGGWERGKGAIIRVYKKDVQGAKERGQVVVGDNARRLAVGRGGEEVHILRQRKRSAQRAYRAEVVEDSAGVRELRCDTRDT